MAEYIDKKQFLASMGLTGDETKYGNRDAEHQHRSYSTYMSYEIMDCVDDSIVEEELAPVVRCRDCKHFLEKGGVLEPWCDWHEASLFDGDGFCSDGERRGDER